MAKLQVTEKRAKVVRQFNLELSEEEATALFVILERIGGNPANTPRRLADNVIVALHADIDRHLVSDMEKCLKQQGSQPQGGIYFRDYSWDINKKRT